METEFVTIYFNVQVSGYLTPEQTSDVHLTLREEIQGLVDRMDGTLVPDEADLMCDIESELAG